MTDKTSLCELSERGFILYENETNLAKRLTSFTAEEYNYMVCYYVIN